MPQIDLISLGRLFPLIDFLAIVLVRLVFLEVAKYEEKKGLSKWPPNNLSFNAK